MAFLDHCQQVLLGKAHRYVLYHHSRKCLHAVQDCMEVNSVVSQLWDLSESSLHCWCLTWQILHI